MQRRIERAVDHRHVIRPARPRHRRIHVRPDPPQHFVDLDRIARKKLADQIHARPRLALRRQPPNERINDNILRPRMRMNAIRRQRHINDFGVPDLLGQQIERQTHRIGNAQRTNRNDRGPMLLGHLVHHELEFVEHRPPRPNLGAHAGRKNGPIRHIKMRYEGMPVQTPIPTRNNDGHRIFHPQQIAHSPKRRTHRRSLLTHRPNSQRLGRRLLLVRLFCARILLSVVGRGG